MWNQPARDRGAGLVGVEVSGEELRPLDEQLAVGGDAQGGRADDATVGVHRACRTGRPRADVVTVGASDDP